MKNIMATILNLLAVLCAGALAARAGAMNPNMIHYSVTETMSATGADTNVTGQVQVFQKQQGNADHQRLRVTVAGLEARTSYALLAQLGDDTNLVTVGGFTTTRSGRGSVLYFQNHAPTSATANRRHVLPASLGPLTEVRALAVADTNGGIVLTVDLHQSPSLLFELASVFGNTGSDPAAIGCVSVALQGGGAQFRLFATGQSSEYTFCVNDQSVATYAADGLGRISVGAFPLRAPSPLEFRKLSVLDAGRQIVLESQLK